MKLFKKLILLAVVLFISCNNKKKSDKTDKVDTVEKKSTVWSSKKANSWYAQQPFLVGANFTPSSAINQLEMWQSDSFDSQTIDEELGLAAMIGMNTMRVYLHDLLYKNDKEVFFNNINSYLEIADKHHIKTMFVLFDSCWDPFPVIGKQREPKPHVHNSGWVQSPGQIALLDSTQYARLKNYVVQTVGRFKNDDRVLAWDIWNEPDNMTGSSYEKIEIPNKVELVYPLLKQAFKWARSQNPKQPLTSGLWMGDWSNYESMHKMHQLQIEQSDIISFHCYDSPEVFEKRIKQLQPYNKPLLCTEYMARPNGSTFQGFLPIAKKYNVAMYNWGLVDGKTQTKYPWNSWTKTYTSEPEVWFHEVFRNTGEPYSVEEVAIIKELTGVNKK